MAISLSWMNMPSGCGSRNGMPGPSTKCAPGTTCRSILRPIQPHLSQNYSSIPLAYPASIYGHNHPANLRPRTLSRFVAGTDVFSRQSDGTTIAQQYGSFGIRFTPANTDRVNGWAEILSRLGDPDAGIPPTLFIHKRCTKLLDCLPALQHDPNHPEDVLKLDADEDGQIGDDTADALRYLVATKPREIFTTNLRGL